MFVSGITQQRLACGPGRRAVSAGHKTRLAPPAALSKRKRATTKSEEVEPEAQDAVLPAAGRKSAVPADKLKALNAAMSKINNKYGANTLQKLGATQHIVESYPSGSLTLDLIMGGGYPKGRIVEIYGPEASGKTTLALHAIAEVQKQGGVACFIDAEHAFDQEYAQRLGINTQDLLVAQPDCGEDALNVADELVRSGAVDLVVIDSVSALVPRAELEGDIGQVMVGAQARLMSSSLRRLSGNVSKTKSSMIFINQLRFKIGVMYGNPEITSGGNSLKYYCSMRLDVRAKEKIEKGGQMVGNKIRVKTAKNKVAPPFQEVEMDIMYGYGIDAQGCTIDAAVNMGVLEKRGSYYYFNDEKLAQGRQAAIDTLKQQPQVMEQIEKLTRREIEKRRQARSDEATAAYQRQMEEEKAEGLANGLDYEGSGEPDLALVTEQLEELVGGGPSYR